MCRSSEAELLSKWKQARCPAEDAGVGSARWTSNLIRCEIHVLIRAMIWIVNEFAKSVEMPS